MKVKELKEYLETLDPEMPVAYTQYSENTTLSMEDLEIKELCEARNDGWVAEKRPDKPSLPYLVFPGN